MTLPTIHVEIDFTSGPSFGYPFVLDSLAYGILDTNILADDPLDLVDVTSQVRKVSTRRGRNRILANFEAGTATVTLNDPNSDFNPQNPSSPYYGKLLPLRKIRIYATTTSGGSPIDINVFSGYITSYDTSFYPGTTADATVTLQCVDGFRLLNNVSTDIPPVPGCPAGQLSGARIQALLDYADWPDSITSLAAGNSTMMADPGGNRSILQAIQTVEQSEFGAFYMSRNGKATFLNRELVSELADVPPFLYTDVYPLGPNEYGYANVDFAFDDQLVLNDVTITRYNDGSIPAPVPQIVLDQDSIDTYFYKSGQRTDLLMQTDGEALDQAQMLVASRKDATLRIDSMRLDLNADINETNTLTNLSLDIYTLINITKTMPGGSTVTRELFVQGVTNDITPGQWIMTVYTAEPIIQAFILDSSTQGILDTNVLTY